MDPHVNVNLARYVSVDEPAGTITVDARRALNDAVAQLPARVRPVVTLVEPYLLKATADYITHHLNQTVNHRDTP